MFAPNPAASALKVSHEKLNQPTGKNQEKDETKKQEQKTQIHNSDQKEKDLYGC